MRSAFPLFWVLFLISSFSAEAQTDRIERTLDSLEAESHLRFLTADELRGRNTGTNELLIAGRYIAEQFRKSGLLPLGDSQQDYLQRVPLHMASTPASGTLSLMEHDFTIGVDMGVLAGANVNTETSLVYVADLKEALSLDLEGKLVATPLRSLSASLGNPDEVQALRDAGAMGLVELFGPGQRYPWQPVLNFLNREQMRVGEIPDDESDAFLRIWVRDSDRTYLQALSESPIS